jgi:hypothetical protein
MGSLHVIAGRAYIARVISYVLLTRGAHVINIRFIFHKCFWMNKLECFSFISGTDKLESFPWKKIEVMRQICEVWWQVPVF